jgi:hypothetical protein
VSRLQWIAAAARHIAARLVPGRKRDWVEAVWAEAPQVPPGLQRLAWRTGGVVLLARTVLGRRPTGIAVLFAGAAGAAAFAAWPGAPANSETPVDRAHVIGVVVLLAGLPLLARPFLGPVGDSRAARTLRIGTCAMLLALIPAETVVNQFDNTTPRGGADLRVYLLVGLGHPRPQWGVEILILVIRTLYVAAILWMTSRRSRVAPATLAAGTVAGISLGAVMYAVAPLGLSKDATNPWLPGSDVDPLLLAAWLLLLFGPVTAAVVADRRYTMPAVAPPPLADRIRQAIAAGLLTSLTGALLVSVLGTSTTAVMLKTAWLRNWLYHGSRSLFGVQNLSSDLRTSPSIAYSHQITGATDSVAFVVICLGFPLIALLMSALAAACIWDPAATGGDGQGPGGGGPPAPGVGPEPSGGSRLADSAHHDAGPPGLRDCVLGGQSSERLARDLVRS